MNGEAGKNFALAYALKKRAKKMAGGGMCAAHGMEGCEVCVDDGADAEAPISDDEIDGAEGDEDMDMIGRIMKQRFSKGGMVANDTDMSTDAEPNEFDELVLDDDLEGSYPGSQEIGNEQEDQDRDDIISRIMRSRSKKDRMPRPA